MGNIGQWVNLFTVRLYHKHSYTKNIEQIFKQRRQRMENTDLI